MGISLVLAPVFFLLYGQEVRPFLGNDSRTVEPWVGPVVGLILLVAVGAMCAVFSIINGKKMQEFKDEVERQYQEASEDAPASGGNAAAPVDSAFIISTTLTFSSEEGAKEYEEAFKLLADSRREFASTYILTKVRNETGSEPKYIE